METKRSLMKLLVGRREIQWLRQQELREFTFIWQCCKSPCVCVTAFVADPFRTKRNLFWTISFPLRLGQTGNNNHRRITIREGRWVPNKKETLFHWRQLTTVITSVDAQGTLYHRYVNPTTQLLKTYQRFLATCSPMSSLPDITFQTAWKSYSCFY